MTDFRMRTDKTDRTVNNPPVFSVGGVFPRNTGPAPDRTAEPVIPRKNIELAVAMDPPSEVVDTTPVELPTVAAPAAPKRKLSKQVGAQSDG